MNRLNINELIKRNLPFSEIVERLEAECHKIYLQYERKVREKWLPKIKRGEVDEREFETSLANSARARAGFTAELIIRYILKIANIPFETRKYVDGEQPDIVIPNVATLKRDPSKAVIL
ncbi:MAG: hypothetical protein QXI58_07845, partial [Candidatus Micrarchaeia archaeon]